MASDLKKVDAYRNTTADYDEVPDMADADPAHVTWAIGDQAVTEAEGKAAMAEARKRRGRPPVEGGKQQIAVRFDRDVIAAFKAGGPGRQGRMNAALRKVAGLPER